MYKSFPVFTLIQRIPLSDLGAKYINDVFVRIQLIRDTMSMMYTV